MEPVIVGHHGIDWTPLVLAVGIPLLIFVPLLLLRLAARRRARGSDEQGRAAPVWLLTVLAIGVPLLVGIPTVVALLGTLGDFDEARRQGETLLLRQSITGESHEVPLEEVARMEVVTESGSGRAATFKFRLRLQLRDGTAIVSNRTGYRPHMDRVIEALGLEVSRSRTTP